MATILWTSQEKLMIISWLKFNWTSKFSGKLSKLRKSCLKEANKAAPSPLRTRQILHIETTLCCPMPNAVKAQWFSARTLRTRTHHLRLCKLGELTEFVFWYGVNEFSRISSETLKSSWPVDFPQQISTSTCSCVAIVIISCLDHLFSPQKMHMLCMKLVDLLCNWPSWWFNSQTEMSGSVSFDRNHELMTTSTGTIFAV